MEYDKTRQPDKTMTKIKELTVNAIGGEVPTNGGKQAISNGLPYRVEVTLQGVCELLFHRYNCEAVGVRAGGPKGSKSKKEDDLESYVYRNDKGDLSIPGTYLRGALLEQSKFLQDPRSPRKCARDLFKAGVVQLTPLASIGKTTWDFVHKGRVLIQRNAITRCWPAIKDWTATFIVMVILPEYVSPDMLCETITNAGKFQGFADFRPTYGRFQVREFKVLNE